MATSSASSWTLGSGGSSRERPALVISVCAFSEMTGNAFVAPVTGTRWGWPFEVPIPAGGRVCGVVLADQAKSIDHIAKHVTFLAESPAGLVEAVLEKVQIILAG